MSLSDKYDEFYSRNDPQRCTDISLRGWPRNRLEAAVSVMGGGTTILDVGCGDGRMLFQFRTRFSEFIGLELSPSRLEQARKNLASLRFRPLLASAESMPEVATNSVDRIISADTIEHIPDVYAATSEMHRVLKPEGILVINTPNVAYIKRRILLMCGRFPSTSQSNEGLGSDILFDGGHFHYFTFRSLTLLLQKAGFHVNGRVGYGRFGKVHGIWPSLTSSGVQLIARKA